MSSSKPLVGASSRPGSGVGSSRPTTTARPISLPPAHHQLPPPSHFYQKICHPFGPCNRPPIPPPISLCLSQVLNRSACSQLPTTASSPKQQAGANFTCVFNI